MTFDTPLLCSPLAEQSNAFPVLYIRPHIKAGGKLWNVQMTTKWKSVRLYEVTLEWWHNGSETWTIKARDARRI